MKTAAGVVAVLAWGSLLAAVWYPLAAGVRPSGAWFGVAIASLLVALIAPAFLLAMDKQPAQTARPSARSKGAAWTVDTRPRTGQPAGRSNRPPAAEDEETQ